MTFTSPGISNGKMTYESLTTWHGYINHDEFWHLHQGPRSSSTKRHLGREYRGIREQVFRENAESTIYCTLAPSASSDFSPSQCCGNGLWISEGHSSKEGES